MRRDERRYRLPALLAAAAFLLMAVAGAYAQDYGVLPNPVLALNGTEEYTPSGGPAIMYKLKVTNWADYPGGLFAARDDLGACGLNLTPSRAWVEIHDGSNDAYIYGFCALGSAGDLTGIWFGELLPGGTTPPASVYIKIIDRDHDYGHTYTSNTISVYTPTAPVANADTLATLEDSSANATVLANDTDINGDALSVSAVTVAPTHGSAVPNGGLVHYTPNPNYNGTDSFTYSVFDGTYTATASVAVTVTAVPDPPNAPTGLLTEGSAHPTNVSTYTPHFAWTFTDPDQADVSGDNQSAYEIRVGLTPGSSTTWDSGKLNSPISGRSYGGPALIPNVTYYWSVRVWDNYGLPSVYSADGDFVILDMGLRIFDGTSVIKVATDYVSAAYPLRISIGGTTFGIVLVDPIDPNASKFRIMTPAGIKAIKKM